MEPTKQWIEDTKAKVGKLFKASIGPETFYFRALKRGEHLQLQEEAFPDGIPTGPDDVSPKDNARLEDTLTKAAVVWPENVDPKELPAGAPSVLVGHIMRVSGFGLVSEPEEV